VFYCFCCCSFNIWSLIILLFFKSFFFFSFRHQWMFLVLQFSLFILSLTENELCSLIPLLNLGFSLCSLDFIKNSLGFVLQMSTNKRSYHCGWGKKFNTFTWQRVDMKIEEQKKKKKEKIWLSKTHRECINDMHCLKKSSFRDNFNGTKKASIGDPRKLSSYAGTVYYMHHIFFKIFFFQISL